MVNVFAKKETAEEPALLTPWSVPHFLLGMAAKERGVPFWWFFVGHALYELKDQVDRDRGGNQNTLENSIGDQAIASLGHVVAARNLHGYIWTALYIASWVGAVALGDEIG